MVIFSNTSASTALQSQHSVINIRNVAMSVSIKSKFGREVMAQFKAHQKVVIDESKSEQKTLCPPIFFDMPRPEQFRTSSMHSNMRDLICCPEGFFGIDHPSTTWMINIIKDNSEWRLQKALATLRTRTMFDSTKYYQVLDRPSHYGTSASATADKPLFGSLSMLYLNAFGIALFLKSDTSGRLLATCKSGKIHLVNPVSPQYGSFVHDRLCDLVKFNYDFLCFKTEYHQGLTFLCMTGWNPCNTSMFLYRRKYYQYGIPFTDWVDTIRFLLHKHPTMNLSVIIDYMYKFQYLINPAYNFSMVTMKEIGKVMMEAFELKELTRYNFNNPTKLGFYAGRKILNNKDVPIPDEYATVFADKDGKPKNPTRPVVPNVMSYVRRLLTYQYYNDGKNLFCLPQIIRAIMSFKQNDFFVVSHTVKTSTEYDSSGAHRVFLDPLVFQINYFLHLKSDGMYLRHKPWPSHSTTVDSDGISEEERAWYYRFDTFNCLSLLSGLLQNALIKNLSDVVIENLCDLIIHILVDSELVEPFLRYSYYDTYFGLTSVINCVPNLMSKTVLRLLKKAPITLVNNYELSHLQRMFSIAFWKQHASHQVEGNIVPKTIEDVAEFLVTKRRRVSMKVEGAATGEAMSGASSIGAAGGITMFMRNYDDMIEISAADELAEQPATETTKKQDDERKHVAEYMQMETEARYSSVYPLFFDGLNKVQVFLNEGKMLNDCIFEAYNQRTLAHLKM